MLRLEERALQAESQAEARASRKVAVFRGKAERAEAESGKKVAGLVTSLLERTLQAESRTELRVAEKVARLEGRALEAESRADARASRKVAHFRNKAVEAETRAVEAESSARQKVASIIATYRARTMQAEKKVKETSARLELHESEAGRARATIVLLEDQVDEGKGRAREVESLNAELRHVKQTTRQAFSVQFDRWREDCQRTIVTGQNQTLQGQVDCLGKAMEELGLSKGNHDRATAELARMRQALEGEQGDLPARQDRLKADQEVLTARDSVLKLRERLAGAEVSTVRRIQDALETPFAALREALEEVTDAQGEVSQQLEEKSNVGLQSINGLKRKLDASIGWGKLACGDIAAAAALNKDLTGMFERHALQQGGKRRGDEGLEQLSSKAVVIDGSAARTRMVQMDAGCQTEDLAEESEDRQMGLGEHSASQEAHARQGSASLRGGEGAEHEEQIREAAGSESGPHITLDGTRSSCHKAGMTGRRPNFGSKFWNPSSKNIRLKNWSRSWIRPHMAHGALLTMFEPVSHEWVNEEGAK
jgi:hypothetical protein